MAQPVPGVNVRLLNTGGLSATGYSLTGLNEVLRDLHAITANAKQGMAQINRSIALVVRGWQLRHFDKQEDSTGARWKPLSSLSIALRGGSTGPILKRTGMLAASIAMQAFSGSGWQIGTRRIQAAVQQYGATILPKRGKFLFIPLRKSGKGRLVSGARSFGSASREYEYTAKSGKTKRSYSSGKGRTVRKTKSGREAVAMLAITKAVVPAREFIYLNPRERLELVETYATELSMRGTSYIRWRGGKRAVA